MIRLIFAVLYVVLYLILSLPVLFVEWIIGKFRPDWKDKSSRAIVAWGFRCVKWIAGTKLVVKGMENLPKEGAVLYVGNHRSFFDIVLSMPLFPGVTGYVSKIENKKVPILPLWMKNIHCHFLDRKDIKQGLKTILACVDEVKNGISICIFPEGTRNKVNDTFLPFRDGSFKIAEKGHVPVVPMVIVNSADILEDHFPFIKKTQVILSFEKPISMDDLTKEEKKNVGAYFSDLMLRRYFELKAEANPANSKR